MGLIMKDKLDNMYLDNLKFAREQRSLAGVIDLCKLVRVQEIDNYTGELNYILVGDVDKLQRPILKISICGIITALCQNCLLEMQIEISNHSVVTIFNTEAQLDAALFAGGDAEVEDGIVADDEFDISEFLEDEVIMLLPYSYKHAECVGLNYHDIALNSFSSLKDSNGH